MRSPRSSGSGFDDIQSSSGALPRPQQHRQTHSDTPDSVTSPAAFHQTRKLASPVQTPSPARPDQQAHIAAASIGRPHSAISPLGEDRPPSPVSAALGASQLSARRRSAARHNRQLSQQNLTEEPDDVSSTQPDLDTQPPAYSPNDRGSSKSHPVVRVSKRTHSAILYALEEALRYPNPFTPDVVEESADMADLLRAGGGAIPSEHRGPIPTSSNAAPPRPIAAPAPTSSPSGIRGPRMIMQERAAREARQREAAERQRAEQARAEEEALHLEEMRRRDAERQSAGAAQRQNASIAQQQAAEAAVQRQQQASQERTQSQQRPSSNTQPTQAPQQPPSQAYLAQGSAAQQRRASEARQAPEPAPAPTEAAKPRNSFPHAFERWETLSAHWEGLTSYWIRKLEQNKDDVNRDPLSQQLARQVTDLSAAGANLFHAVVELQRLRASSERKFQRWFFETRSELERAQEVNALLEKTLEKERRERAEAIREAVDHERGVSKTQKQLQEMRKELAISKEEARRAWEELGRREQEERDRTSSLQNGQPTIVGGVQVVPMSQSHGTRQASSRDPGTYQTTETSRTPSEHRSPGAAGSSSGGHYAQAEGSASSQHRGQPIPAEEPEYHRQNEYILDAQGQPVLDKYGKKILYQAPPSAYSGSEQEAEEYETPATTNPPSGGHEPPPSAPGGGNNNGQWTGAYSNAQDYTGEGYGAPGWETVQRHHHPTRLSDVIEEDERSRASTQMSRF